MQQRSTITYHLVRSLNDQEKLQFTKFLSVFGTPSHKNLMDACLELQEFNDNILWRLSKIGAKNHFNKCKSELKGLLLDFLRFQGLKSYEAKWHKEMDYAEIYRDRGKPFYDEGYRILFHQLEETQKEEFWDYTLVALRAFFWFLNFKDTKNTQDWNIASMLTRKSVSTIDQVLCANEYYQKISCIIQESYLIKSREREQQVKKFVEHEFYSVEIKDVNGVAAKAAILSAQTLLNIILRQKELLEKCAYNYENLFINPNSPYPKIQRVPESKLNYFHHLSSIYIGLCAWDRLEGICTEFKTLLSRSYSPKEKHPMWWGFYYRSYYSHKIYGPSGFEPKDLSNLKELIDNFCPLLPVAFNIGFHFFACIGALKIDYHNVSLQEAYTILDAEKYTTVRSDFIEVARYLLPIIQLTSLLHEEEQTAITWEYFKNTASQQYEYFRKKEKKYYQLEIRVTGFLKTLNKPVNQAETLEILDQLKCRIQEAEANDYLNQVKEIQRHFNLYEWIDREKHRLLNQFRRSA